MLKIDNTAARKIIYAYHVILEKEKADPGSQSKSTMEILYKASSVCENAANVSWELGTPLEVILSDEMVENLACIAQYGVFK